MNSYLTAFHAACGISNFTLQIAGQGVGLKASLYRRSSEKFIATSSPFAQAATRMPFHHRKTCREKLASQFSNISG
jgi:hypothetical protein